MNSNNLLAERSDGQMELIDNVNKTLKNDLMIEMKKDSKVSIAAACFSIYAFAELKKR